MVLPDRLSRFRSCRNNFPIELHQNIQAVSFNPDHLNIIGGAIDRFPIHSTIYRLILNGWSDKMRDVLHLASHFWGTRDKLTIEEGVLLKGSRVCRPPELHDRSLHELYDNHLGIENNDPYS